MIFIFFKQRATRRALRTGRCPLRLTLAPRALRKHGRWRGFGAALMLMFIILLAQFNRAKCAAVGRGSGASRHRDV